MDDVKFILGLFLIICFLVFAVFMVLVLVDYVSPYLYMHKINLFLEQCRTQYNELYCQVYLLKGL